MPRAARLCRRRRVLGRGRLAHRARFPVPVLRERDRGRRHARSTSRTRSATPSRRSSATLFARCSNACRTSTRRVISRPLPQRPGPGRRQLAGGDRGGRAPGRVHDQRHRRARRQRLAGRDGDGAQDAQRPAAVLHRHRHASRSPEPRRWSAASPACPSSRTRRSSASNAFAHEAGIHQDGMLKDARAPTRSCGPRTSADPLRSLVLGKHSGRHAFKKLVELGYELSDEELNRAFAASRSWPTRRRRVRRRTSRRSSRTRPREQRTPSGGSTSCRYDGRPRHPTATWLHRPRGRHPHRSAGVGDGPVDATFNAIKQLVPHSAKLALFQIHAVTEGTDAQAEVTVRLEESGKTVNGQGAETDTILASARAYVAALNKLLVKREKTGTCCLDRLTTSAGCAQTAATTYRGRPLRSDNWWDRSTSAGWV